MKPKRPTEFLSFSDGVLYIYGTDTAGETLPQPKCGIAYDNKVVGSKRHYEAKAVNEQVDKLIQVPLYRNIVVHDMVRIAVDWYEVVQLQELGDTNPPSYQLSLRQVRAPTGNNNVQDNA